MSTSTEQVTERGSRARAPRRTRAAAAAYLVLAAIGLVGTWSFNIAYVASGGGSYLGDWFANAAAGSAAVDILVVLVVAALFYLRASAALGWRRRVAVLFIVLSVLVAVSFALPLFLALRELAIGRRDDAAPAD